MNKNRFKAINKHFERRRRQVRRFLYEHTVVMGFIFAGAVIWTAFATICVISGVSSGWLK